MKFRFSLVIMIAAAVCLLIIDQASAGDLVFVPDAAWKRAFGDVPEKAAANDPDRGLPLGGIGAGNMVWTYSGNFKHWQIDTGEIYEGVVPGNQFHLAVRNISQDSAAAEAVTFNTSKLKFASWKTVKVGSGNYAVLYPRGVANWEKTGLAVTTGCEFYSPILPHNYRETSYPGSVFNWRIKNPTTDTYQVTLAVSWENKVPTDQRRAGLKTRLTKRGDHVALVLDSTTGTEEMGAGTEFALAATNSSQRQVSVRGHWNPEGDGADLYDDLLDDGLLDGSGLGESPDRSAAALAVTVTLRPGETADIPLTIAWDFPIIEFAAHTQWYRRYTEYVGRSGDASAEVAIQLLEKNDALLRELIAWQNSVVNDPRIPRWLGCALFNELYFLAQGGTIWEAGLKSGHEEEFLGLHIKDNKFALLETTTYNYPFYNTLDVAYYSSIVLPLYWPEIEKDMLRPFADAIMDEPLGQTPHDMGAPRKNAVGLVCRWKCDPFFFYDDYGTNRLKWKDLHSKFVLMVYRDFLLTKDRSFLQYMWPAVKRTMGYLQSTDTNGNGLPNNEGSDQTYDFWSMEGTSTYCGGLMVGALEASLDLAEILEDGPAVLLYQPWLEKARISLEKEMWNGSYYQFDSQSDSVMADALAGEWYAKMCGLPGVFPVTRARAHLNHVFDLNVKPMEDFDGDGIGDRGAINGRQADGSPIPKTLADHFEPVKNFWKFLKGNSRTSKARRDMENEIEREVKSPRGKQGNFISYLLSKIKEKGHVQAFPEGGWYPDEVWTGVSYALSALMVYLDLPEPGLLTGRGVYLTTYEDESCAHWFATPEAWDWRGLKPRADLYLRPMSVWGLYLALTGSSTDPADRLENIFHQRMKANLSVLETIQRTNAEEELVRNLAVAVTDGTLEYVTLFLDRCEDTASDTMKMIYGRVLQSFLENLTVIVIDEGSSEIESILARVRNLLSS